MASIALRILIRCACGLVIEHRRTIPVNEDGDERVITCPSCRATYQITASPRPDDEEPPLTQEDRE